MKKLLGILLLAFPVLIQAQPQKAIVSGVSWYDQRGETVSAHGANIICDGRCYYLFGEYKTDSANVFTGFSCYSSDNLVDSASWSAKLPQEDQERLAEELISKGGNINFIKWEAGSVLPESGKGMEHMASFDFAYKLAAVRDWLFKQTK